MVRKGGRGVGGGVLRVRWCASFKCGVYQIRCSVACLGLDGVFGVVGKGGGKKEGIGEGEAGGGGGSDVS